MRNLLLFTLLLGAVVAFGWSAMPSAAWSQEQRDTGGMDINFNVEGPEFDAEAQRAAAEAAGAAVGAVMAPWCCVIWLRLAC